jgi:quercetin dioxygenase-like cupin family protein
MGLRYTCKPGESVAVDAGRIHEGINKGNTPIKAIATFVIPKEATLTTQVKSQLPLLSAAVSWTSGNAS